MREQLYFDHRVIKEHESKRVPLPEPVITRLRGIVKTENVLTLEADRRIYSRDFWPLAILRVNYGQELPLPGAVVLPANTEEVSTILEFLYKEGIPVVPYGGGSGVLGGAMPVTGGVVVDTKRMDRIKEINDINLTVVAEPGILGVDLEEALGREGYTLGHFPQSVDTATLGGLIATRSSGQFSTKYGNIEDMLLAVEVVLPDGRVIQTKKTAARSSTGPDLTNLFLGSEGKFGIITEAVLRIHPAPEKRVSESFSFDTFEDGLEATRLILRKGFSPAVIRLYDVFESHHSFADFIENGKNILIFVMEGDEALVDLEQKVVLETCQKYAGAPLGSAPGEAWLKKRNNIGSIIKLLATSDKMVLDTIEVAITWDGAADLNNEILRRVREVEGILVASSHTSHAYTHGINFYVTFIGQANGSNLEADAERVYIEAWTQAMEACLAKGGTISHHHGVGLHRVPWMAQEHGSSLHVLKELYHALDPKGLMNPGKLLGEVEANEG